ncbi:MAG: ABC transporter substrate-binding protein [Acidobacteria bacterium]|nr:ABC transporter substrate-binding protein [Acidobacteriota bacterium]
MGEQPIRILASRHSAFYSPLLATLAGGFLRTEGWDATYAVLPKGRRARDLIRNGETDIAQAAVSSSWGPMEKGEKDLPVHFAQINQRDGFFLTGRRAEPSFQWKLLEGASLLADHGGQPLAMLQYAAHRMDVDWSRIVVINAGGPEEMDATFRTGRGDYVHLQGPAPQQLEAEGIGHVAAAVGEVIPPVAFSSLMASRAFLETRAAQAFMRAFRKARLWVTQAPAEEVAAAEARFFPAADPKALADAIMSYQALGCWDGEPEIGRGRYEQALEVFLHSGGITRRHTYEEVVVSPPA